MSEFHFLRPLWFLVLVPLLWLLIMLWRKQSSGTAWNTVFDQQLLAPLWLESPGKSSRLPLFLLAAGWLLAVFILAGPVWERQPEHVWRAQLSRVIILDLSPSMNADDVSPSRLERARFKIMDILARSNEGRTGLVVFSGEAHIVTPLTEDNATIINLITALQTEIMPTKGDNVTLALEMAGDLLNLTGIHQGELLLISDGIADPAAALTLVRDLRKQGYQLSVLGIGTEQGGAMYQDGVAEFVYFNAAPLQALARAGGGKFSLITTDDQDLSRLLPDIKLTGTFDKVESSGIERWIEKAVWLLPLILLLAACAFRRGWLMGFAVLLIIPPPAHAFGWQDLWQRSDQQAQKQLHQGDPQTAAQQFRNPNWRGMALYEMGDYTAAAQAFAESDNVYNQGNALAQAGELQQAIAAYQEVLQQNPDHQDARANLDLLEELLKQQPPQDDDSSPSEEGDESPSSEDKSDDMSDNPEDSTHQDEAESSDDENSGDELSDKNSDQQQTDASQTEQDESDEQRDALEANRVDENHDLPSEEDIALEQWLRQIPEDPSGLLRRKFMLEHLQRKQTRQ